MFDFSNLKVRKKKSTRKGVTGGGRKGVIYDIRLIQSQKRSFFQMHPSYMEKMGFVSGKGFFNALISDANGKSHALAMVVADTHDSALFFGTSKGEEKSSQFKGELLLEDLVLAGLVTIIDANSIADRKPVYQYLSLEDVTSQFPAEKVPAGVVAIYAFVKGEAIEPEAAEDEEEVATVGNGNVADDFSIEDEVAAEVGDEVAAAELSEDEWS